MKILLLKQNVTDLDTLNKGIVLVKQWASTIGLNLDFTQVDTNKKFSSIQIINSAIGTGYVVNPTEIFQEAKRLGFIFDNDSIACLIYDWNLIIPKPTNPAENGMTISIPAQWYMNFPEVFASYFLHELSHYYFSFFGKLDLTHLQYDPMWNGQFNQKSNIDYYLFLLKDYIKPMQTYKYFKPNEIVGLRPELVSILDKMRGECGFAFIINSGFRTIKENSKLKDAVQDSAHTLGLAVDLKCLTSDKRFKLVNVAINNGIKRIGIGDTFVHLDISKTLPQNVMWNYN